MINLIPKEAKKRMTIDFYYRLAILFLTMVDFCVIILILSMFPSYFLSSVKLSLANTKLESQKNELLPVFDQHTLIIIKDTNSRLDLIEKAEKDKFLLSVKIINAILIKKMPNIKITQISYEIDKAQNNSKKISIRGTAPSRAALLLFRQALDDSTNFKNVDLPISNFIKGSNIQFYLTLTPS